MVITVGMTLSNSYKLLTRKPFVLLSNCYIFVRP